MTMDDDDAENYSRSAARRIAERGRGVVGSRGRAGGPSSYGRSGLGGLTVRDSWTDGAEGPDRHKLRKERRKSAKQHQKDANVRANASRAHANTERREQHRREKETKRLDVARPLQQPACLTIRPGKEPLAPRHAVRVVIPSDVALLHKSKQELTPPPTAVVTAPPAVPTETSTSSAALLKSACYIPPQKRKVGAELSTTVRRICNKLTEGNTAAMAKELAALFDVEGHARNDVMEAFCDAMKGSVLQHTALTSTVVLGYVGVIRAIQLQFSNAATARIFEFVAVEASAALAAKDDVVARNAAAVFAHLMLLHCCAHGLVTTFIRRCMQVGTIEAIQAALSAVRAAGDRLRRDCPAELNKLVDAAASVLEEKRAETSFPRVRMSVFVDVLRAISSGKTKTSVSAGAVGELDTTALESVQAQLIEHLSSLEGNKKAVNRRAVTAALATNQVMHADFQQCLETPKPPQWWAQHGNTAAVLTEGADDAAPDKVESAVEVAASKPSKKKHRAEVRDDDDEVDAARSAAEIEADDEARRKRAAQQSRAVDIAMSGLRINTELRKRIFVSVAASSDDSDCYLRMMQLGVATATNMHDVAAVLLQCAVQEKTVNLFYARVLQRLCAGHKKFKAVLQFALWDRFKLVEQSDVDVCGYINLASAITHFVSERVFSMPLLRGLDVDQGISKKGGLFLRILLLRLLLLLDAKQLTDFCFGIDASKKKSDADDDGADGGSFGDPSSFSSVSDVVTQSKQAMRKALLKFFTNYFVDQHEASAWMPHLIDVVGAGIDELGEVLDGLPARITAVRRALRDGV